MVLSEADGGCLGQFGEAVSCEVEGGKNLMGKTDGCETPVWGTPLSQWAPQGLTLCPPALVL